MAVTGSQAGHVIAFARDFAREQIVVAVGRQFAPLTGGGTQWLSGTDATVTDGAYEDALSPRPGPPLQKIDLNILFKSISCVCPAPRLDVRIASA